MMVSCSFCGKDLDSDDVLVEHKKMRINLKCKRCDRPFVNHCALDGHLAHAHSAISVRTPGSIQAGKDTASKNTATGDTRKENKPPTLPRREGQEADGNMTKSKAAAEPKSYPKVTKDVEKDAATRPDEHSVHPETSAALDSDKVMIGGVAFSSRDIGFANRMACPVCNKAEGSLMALRIHQVVHEHCYCKECKAFFLSDSAQKEHMASIHSLTCKFKDCGKLFGALGKLQEHQIESGHCYCKQYTSFISDQSGNLLSGLRMNSQQKQ